MEDSHLQVRYVTIVTNEDTLVKLLEKQLAESPQKDITVKFCLDYIHNQQEHSQIIENIKLLREKIDELDQQIQEQVVKEESLRIRCDQLLQKEPEFKLVEVGLQKLGQINSSPI